VEGQLWLCLEHAAIKLKKFAGGADFPVRASAKSSSLVDIHVTQTSKCFIATRAPEERERMQHMNET
jgi:hypothetical protein